MEGKHVLGVVLISVGVSFAVTLGVLAYAMRAPLPLIDTANSRAVFTTDNAAAAAMQKAG